MRTAIGLEAGIAGLAANFAVVESQKKADQGVHGEWFAHDVLQIAQAQRVGLSTIPCFVMFFGGTQLCISLPR